MRFVPCGTALLGLTITLGQLNAQDAAPVSCDDWQYAEQIVTCGLRAAGLDDLAATPLPHDGREIRFLSIGSLGVPFRVTIIRQFGDSVSGRHLLVWYPDQERDEFFDQLCGTSWANAAARICEGRLASPPDWRALLARLDSIGIAQLPIDPPPNCPAPPSDSTLGGCLYTDGVSEVVEYRDGDRFWRHKLDEFGAWPRSGRGFEILEAVGHAVVEAPGP